MPDKELRPRTRENVYLFVPNLIGYTRVVLALVSLTYMSTHPKMCTLTYSISCLLDAVDGHAARLLGQTSQFGAILDMVTDRSTTSCLLCYLAITYPAFAIVFQLLISLDFSSHYIHMYATLFSGSTSHKKVTREQSFILWSYYNNSNTLFVVCAGNELFYVALYLMYYYTTPLGLAAWLPAGVAGALPHELLVLAHTITWPQIVAAATFPIFALKQFVNVVQFYKAAQTLVENDQETRYAAQAAKAA